ncbi:MAG: cytochrome P450 [Cyanobacteria bacterium P01_A01_bin.84]
MMITLAKKSSSDSNYKSIPKTLEPFFFHTLWGIFNPSSYFETMQKRYGDMYRFPRFFGFSERIVISNPKAIQQIFTADASLFESASKVVQPLAGDNSVILQDGQRHIRQRKLLMPPFHGERMRNYGEQIRKITQQVMDKVNPGETFVARPVMQEISSTIILHTIFGLTEGERYQQVKDIFTEISDIFNKPFNSVFLYFKVLQKNLGKWSPWGNFLHQKQRLDELLFAIIQERRAQGETESQDILSMLLAVRDEEGNPMSDEELKDELVTMFFAGTDNTATALAWSLYWVHHLPEVREKLLAELKSVDIQTTDSMKIIKLPYLNAVCSETLRIYPIAIFSIGRVLQAPMQILDYNVPKGIVLYPCIYLTHRNPKVYSEPEKFKPERFLERQFTPYEYLPFGGGNRRCLGMAFALFEMKLVLATLLSCYSFKSMDKKPLPVVIRSTSSAPKGGVKLMMERS